VWIPKAHNRLAKQGAAAIYSAFGDYEREFQAITSRAKVRFEQRSRVNDLCIARAVEHVQFKIFDLDVGCIRLLVILRSAGNLRTSHRDRLTWGNSRTLNVRILEGFHHAGTAQEFFDNPVASENVLQWGRSEEAFVHYVLSD
jgi:isocitrate dehydrogenase kinase/phosphatase